MACYWFGCSDLLIVEYYTMASIYIVLKIVALLAVIVIPLAGPKRKKTAIITGVSKFAVNEEGYLEHYIDKPVQSHSVQ